MHIVSHFRPNSLAAPGIEMGQVSCGLRGMHSWPERGMLERRAEISSWEVVKDARMGAVSLQQGCLLG